MSLAPIPNARKLVNKPISVGNGPDILFEARSNKQAHKKKIRNTKKDRGSIK